MFSTITLKMIGVAIYCLSIGDIKFGKVSINGKRPLSYRLEVTKTNEDRYKTYIDNIKVRAEELLIKN
jgi:hypothetical protein